MAKASLAKVKKVDDDQPKDKQAPHEINSALSSPRMQALLKEHQEMGVRPK
jgi:hypothetical protein